jgi:hypothetical protein
LQQTSLPSFPAERLFLFHPFTKENRTWIKDKVASLPYIENDGLRALFSPYLSESTKARVIMLFHELNGKIKQAIAAKMFEEVHEFLRTLVDLEHLDIAEVKEMIDKEKDHIRSMLVESHAYLICTYTITKRFDLARETLKSLDDFNKIFFHVIDIGVLQNAIDVSEEQARNNSGSWKQYNMVAFAALSAVISASVLKLK